MSGAKIVNELEGRHEMPPSKAAAAVDQGDLLALLQGTAVRLVQAEARDLSARQLATFLTCYLTQGPHTVRGLAARLNVAKPAITRVLDRLAAVDLIKRAPDPADRRSLHVRRTPAGAEFLRGLTRIMRDSYKAADKASRAPANASRKDRR